MNTDKSTNEEALEALMEEVDVNAQAIKNFNQENQKPKKKNKINWTLVCAIVVALAMLGGIIYICVDTVNYIENIGVTAPEAVVETTECTSAPVIEQTVESTINILPEPTETIPVEETEPEPTIDPDTLEMLAIVIYQEAGGNRSCDLCRRRVADVVLNRVADPRFPDTIEEVLTQKKQYGRLHWTGIKWPERAKYDTEQEAVARAYRIAEEVLLGDHSDLYGEGYIWQAEFKQGRDKIYHCGHWFGR